MPAEREVQTLGVGRPVDDSRSSERKRCNHGCCSTPNRRPLSGAVLFPTIIRDPPLGFLHRFRRSNGGTARSRSGVKRLSVGGTTVDQLGTGIGRRIARAPMRVETARIRKERTIVFTAPSPFAQRAAAIVPRSPTSP